MEGGQAAGYRDQQHEADHSGQRCSGCTSYLCKKVDKVEGESLHFVALYTDALPSHSPGTQAVFSNSAPRHSSPVGCSTSQRRWRRRMPSLEQADHSLQELQPKKSVHGGIES